MNKKRLTKEQFESELKRQHRGTRIYSYNWPGFPRSTYYYHTSKPSWLTKALGVYTNKGTYEFGESRVCVAK